jgi:hypothetical protein
MAYCMLQAAINEHVLYCTVVLIYQLIWVKLKHWMLIIDRFSLPTH